MSLLMDDCFTPGAPNAQTMTLLFVALPLCDIFKGLAS